MTIIQGRLFPDLDPELELTSNVSAGKSEAPPEVAPDVTASCCEGLSAREVPLSQPHARAMLKVGNRHGLSERGLALKGCFYPYRTLTHTARIRPPYLRLRFSHRFSGAKPEVISAVTEILLRKLFRMRLRKVDREVCRKAEQQLGNELRKEIHTTETGRKHPLPGTPVGLFFNLEEIRDAVAARFWPNAEGLPVIHWSSRRVRSYWGKYSFVTGRILVNKTLDQVRVPRYVLDLVVYHELLHHRLGIVRDGSRNLAHTREFRRLELLHPDYERGRDFLARFRF